MRLKRNSYQTGRGAAPTRLPRGSALPSCRYVVASACPCRQALSRRAFLTSAPRPPSGDLWLHEIKHDGFRVIGRKTGKRVKLYSRPGNDLTRRFPLIVEALGRLRARSCIIDGEAVACGDDGIACFELIRRWDTDEGVLMWAFDLIELDGTDMRRDPLAVRKADWPKCWRGPRGDCSSMSISSRKMARSSFVTPASSVSKASYRSAATRRTAPAARGTGSRARIRMRRQ
jgi:hypothetical protein